MGDKRTLSGIAPVLKCTYKYQSKTYHSVAVKKKEYLAICRSIGATTPDEIPAIYLEHHELSNKLFDLFEIEQREGTTLTVSPEFGSQTNELNLRKYLGLAELERVQLETHLPAEMYTKAYQTAQKSVIKECEEFVKRLRAASDRRKCLQKWVDETVPLILRITKKDWWARYVEDCLDTLEVAELHHKALGRIRDYDRYLAQIMVGTCYFFSIQMKDPYPSIEEAYNDPDD